MFCNYLLLRISQPANLLGWDTVRIHPYVHPLHRKVLKHFIHVSKGNLIQSEVDHSLNHVVVVWFVPICCTEVVTTGYKSSHTMSRERQGTPSDLTTHLSYIYKLFKHLLMQWIAIWMHPYGHQTHGGG